MSTHLLASLSGSSVPAGDGRSLAAARSRATSGGDDADGFAALLAHTGGLPGRRTTPARGHAAGPHERAPTSTASTAASLTSASLTTALQGPCTATGQSSNDSEDSLWTERTTARGKADAAKRRNGGRENEKAVAPLTTEQQNNDDDKKSSTANTPQSQQQSWMLSTLTSSRIERADAVTEVPAGPLMVATDHLRALLPEGGRVLSANAQQVRLELPHPSGPMLLEVSLRSGVVDVRARGGAAAEMAWHVPELAAALQTAGVRLGAFEVAPMQKTGDTATADDGAAGDRQNSDDPRPQLRRSEPQGVIAGIASAFTTP